jgi:signal recognition particle receptor subunit beta
MPIYKSTDGIAKINTTSAIFRGAEMVFGSGLFVSASGGNITTDGDYKIHTFSTPGTSSFIIAR